MTRLSIWWSLTKRKWFRKSYRRAERSQAAHKGWQRRKANG